MRKIFLLLFVPLLFFGIILATQQDQKNTYTIGISKWVDGEDYDKNILGFKEGLKALGFIEGENVNFIEEVSNADKDKQRTIAQKFVKEKVDLIYSLTTPGTDIVIQYTTDIPIVFSIVTFPVEVGFVSSMDSSKNNLVGTSNFVSTDLQLKYITKLVDVNKIGFVHRTSEKNSAIQYEKFANDAKLIGIEIIDINGANEDELETAIMKHIDNVDVLYLACDTLIQKSGGTMSINIAKLHKKIVFSCNSKDVENGALFGAVADFHDIGLISGKKAGFILLGREPSEIPSSYVISPTIIINKKTLDEFGIDIPSEIELSTDKWIN